MSEKVLEMKHIGKSFHGIQVLSDVNFDVRRGEVHCLLGENGAGKSTLIKILSGAYCLESGEIILDGKPLVNNSPSKSIQAGVSVVYQELNMIPDLPIYENVFIGKEFTKGICFDRKRQIQETQRYLDIVGLKVDPRTLVGTLSIAQQQMVEIAKAISNNAKVLVLDEPTASITDKEVEILFKTIQELRANGMGIIYISHRMAELFEIGDRITVLRDGCYVGTQNIEDITEAGLTRMMVGRDISFEFGTCATGTGSSMSPSICTRARSSASRAWLARGAARSPSASLVRTAIPAASSIWARSCPPAWPRRPSAALSISARTARARAWC